MPKKFVRNLQFGVGFSLLVLITSSLASYWSINKQMENRESLTVSRRSITAVNDVLIALLNAETANRGYQITGNSEYLEPFYRGLAECPLALSRAKAVGVEDGEQSKRLAALEKSAKQNVSNLSFFVDNKKRGKKMTPEQMNEEKRHMDTSRSLVSAFVHQEEKQLDLKKNDLDESSFMTVLFIIISSLAAIIVSIVLYFRLRNDFIRRDRLEKELVEKDAEMTRRVKAIQQIANQVAGGDYNLKVQDNASDNLGELVGSLNYMIGSLRDSFERINQSDWLQKGLALLNESLVGKMTVKNVVSNALSHIIEYGGCNNGAIYLLEDGLLKLSFSVGLEDSIKKSFAIGEGVVGQVFEEGKMKVFENLEDNHFSVSVANGKIKAKSILLMPIVGNGGVIGVIEVASINLIEKNQIDYFLEGNRNIGLAIIAATAREKEQRLLEETQAQTEELQVQHTELEHLNVELEAQTQKLQASEEELRVQQEELMQSNAELEERSKLLEEKNQLIAGHNLEIQKKAEELALSTQYKSEFLANMSHELRTPLNSILLLSRLMAENTDNNLNDDQIESAKVIQSSGNSLLTLIDEILDLAKIESGKMTLEYLPVKINDVVKDLKNLFSPIAKEKGLQFIIDVDQSVPATIETDRLRLDQVLRNLLSNAFKFTKEGSVTLSIRQDFSKAHFLAFTVKDTGIGIPQEKQKLIFEAFQQADGSTQRQFGGTGLGLSISREIAKLLGGRLILTSELNKGSEFGLVIPAEGRMIENLPVAEKENEIKEQIYHYPIETDALDIPDDVEDDRSNISADDKVILIVEDDTHFAKALLKYARLQSYKGVVVVRGDKALSAAIHYHPVAILLDVQLPMQDGWQVMADLKANAQTKAIPVHMMSSLQLRKESLMKGAIDFIDKPVALEQMSDVFKKIEEALKKSPQKVLIAEENTKHANALFYFLSNFNISLAVENNVEDSVKALTSGDVDCVILDIELSKGNGYHIIETIKSYEGLENLPVIIFTNRNLSQAEELKLKQYADSIVVKTAHSYQRILDEVGLFLHLVEEKNSSPDTIRNKTIGSLTEVLSGKKILVADDDVRNIFSLTKALETYKVEVVLAVDGKQALEQIKSNPDIDAVLMDMMMPELDGYETIREIRKMPSLEKLPIIAVTAKSQMEDREKCMQAGASDYITKPIDLDQLLSLLRVWLYDNLS